VTVGGPIEAGFIGSPAPNPTQGTSTVEFAIARSSMTDLAVYDVNGRRVRSIYTGLLAPGRYTKVWDGRTDRFSNATAGVYFFVLNSGEGIKTQRVTMMR
jgi:hypothetical protein